MISSSGNFVYDVFISYSHRDSEWVLDSLLPILKENNVKVCIDRECFELGAPIITEIEKAVEQSRKTLLVFTPKYLESKWTEFENILVSTLDPSASERRCIPIMLAPCEFPPRFRALIYLDFSQPGDKLLQWEKLIRTLKPQENDPKPINFLPKPKREDSSQLKIHDEFTRYEDGLEKLQTLISPKSQYYDGMFSLTENLKNNIYKARYRGDSQNTKSERFEILARLNRLAHLATGKPFTDLCETQ